MSTKTGTHHDMHHHAGKHLVALQEWLHDDVYLPAYDYVFDWLFLGIPEHYPFKKKLMIFRANSKIGDTWDVVQLVLVVFTGITYAYTRYSLSFTQTSIIFLFELIITQFFMIDFLLNWYLAISMFHFFIDPMTLVDILTMIPVYVTLFTGLSNTSINFFRCLRIARLMRMFRTVKAIKNLNPVRRQVVNMVVTLMSMIYLAGSVIQLMEDDIFQLSLNCSYINANTGFKPSCSAYSFTTDNCDCTPNNCVAVYLYHDPEGQPSGIRCNVISFYQSIYFVVVTMATVGYGDFYPVTDYGRLVVIIFIIMSLVVIPTRLTELQRLLSMRSPYSMPYVKSHATDKHVVVCGHVNNSQKLERFFQEFFHEDHATVMGNEYHCVILSAREPPEDVRSLLSNPLYDNKVSFIVGSALNIDDLKKARCDISSCMFFLADMKADDGNSGSEDAATVLRALSVSNFNHELTCLVQVLRPEERVILKDSDISVILCLEEYKTALQARNAVCPGFSTIVENLFHSIETISDEDLDVLDIVWYREYLHGASLELYLMQLPKSFIIKMRYNYHRIVEGVYLKYNVVMLGLTCEDNSSIIFNPSRNDMDVFKHMKGMFKSFNIALVMAEDQHVANEISKELGDPEIQEQVLMCLEQAEKLFPCRGRAKTRKQEEAEEVVNEDPAPAPLTWSSKKTSPSSGLQQGLGLGILQEDEEAEDADSDDSIVELKQQVKGVKAVPMIKPTVLEENNNATNVTAALKNIMMSTLSKSEKNQLIALCSSVDNNVAAVINALATPDSPMDDDTLRSILMTHAPNGAVPSNSVFGNVVQSITNSSAAFNFLKTPPVFPSSPEKQNADDEITGVSRRVSASAVPIEDIDTDDLSSDANGFSDSDIDSGSERSSDEEEELNVGANGVKRKRYIGYKVVRKPKLTLPLLSNNINSRKSNASSAANTANGSDRNMSPSPGALQVVTETRLSGSSTSSNASGSNGPATSTVPATPSAPVKPNESKTMESCSFVTPAPQKQALVHSSSVPINDPNNSAWSNKTPRTNVPPHRLAPLSSSPGRATKRKKPLFTAPSALGPPLVLLSTQPKLDESGTPMKRPISAKGFRRVPEKGDSNKVGQSAHMDSSAGGTELDENVGAAEGDEGYSSAPPATIGTDRVQLPRPGQRPVSANVHTSVQASVDAPMRPKSAGPTPASARSPTGRVSIAELMSAPSCVDSNDESKESDDESELDDDDFVKTDGGSSEEEKLNSPKTATSTSTGTGAGISASAGPGTSVGTTTGGGISLAARKPFGLFSLNRLKAPAADAPALAVPAPVSAQRVASPNSLNSSDDGSISESSGDSDYESSECDDDVSVEEQEEDEEKLAGRAEWEKEYGRTSREVKMAKVKNHVILFGCDEHLPMFISELRREAVTGDSYHPILIVAEVPPIKWTSIMNRYNDIYFLRGDISSLDVFNKVNIEQAYSLIIMNVSGSSKNKSRGDQVVSVAVAKSSDDLSSGGLSEMDEESMDAVTLFTYLKLEQYIPLHVFCSVELNCTTNMAVMNATIMRRARARELQDAAARSRPIGVYSGLSERRRSSLRSLNDEGMVSRKNSVFGHHSDNGEDHEPVNMWESFLQVLTSCSDKIIGRLGDDDGKESSDIPPPPNSDAPGGGSSPMGTPILGSPILGSPKSLLSRKRLAENTPSPAPPQSVVAMVPVGGVSNSGRRKSAFGSLGIDDFSLLTHTSAAKEANSSNERHNGRHSASPTPGQQGSIGSALELRSSRRNSLSHPDEGADHGKLQRSSSQRVPSVDLGASFYSKFLFAFRFCGLDKERMRSRSASDDNRASVSAGLLPVGANAKHHKENKLWDALTTHHMLPVFAAAKAFVPTSFESLLVQSFYLSLTPVICEKLVCGQVDQIIIQIALPAVMDGHPFVSLFRLFMNYKVLCLGLYRSANDLESGALLPYVFLGPLGGTVLRAQDRVFLYGTVKDTDNAIKYITNKLSTPPESHYDR